MSTAHSHPDPGPYARAVVDALRAADVVADYETDTNPPMIVVHLDSHQCAKAGYQKPVHLTWSDIHGWRYGPEDPDEPDVRLWSVPIGAALLPTPADLVDLVDWHILHTTWQAEPEYRTDEADDDLAGQLARAAAGGPAVPAARHS